MCIFLTCDPVLCVCIRSHIISVHTYSSSCVRVYDTYAFACVLHLNRIVRARVRLGDGTGYLIKMPVLRLFVYDPCCASWNIKMWRGGRGRDVSSGTRRVMCRLGVWRLLVASVLAVGGCSGSGGGGGGGGAAEEKRRVG